MNNWWDKQIQRADKLNEQSSGSQGLLKFYAQLLRSQKEIYEYLRTRRGWLPSGEIETDLLILCEGLPTLLNTVELYGPEPLASEAKSLLESKPEAVAQLLRQYWSTPSDLQFFAKACLQPYFKWLVETGGKPVGRSTPISERRCPSCGGGPQVSFFQQKESGAESGNRDLICGSCLTSWEFRRVVCANCGEERPAKLGYFHSPEFDHVRIEACDTCKHYIKGIDLTRLGYAVPLVDEVYAAPLDLWARDHGYTKIELNLIGI
jgi:FdhE protein